MSAARSLLGLLLLLLLLVPALNCMAQEPMVRVYANSQDYDGTRVLGPLFSVNNPQHAVDQQLHTHSTISITVLGFVWQRLRFPEPVSAGTPVRVKIGTAGNLLSLLGNLQIQAFHNNTAVGSPEQLGSLINLLAGEDQAEVVFTPTATYDAVRIYYSGVALASGFRIYEAYYLKPAESPIACEQPADVLHGSTGGILGGLNAIDNAAASIDGNWTTATTMRANVEVGSQTHLTALFNTTAPANDSMRIILRSPAGLLDASLLTERFAIRTYLDGTLNGTLALDPTLLSLNLLAPESDIQVLTYPIAQPFNRIEIALGGGLLDALASLEVFEILRIPAKPLLSAPGLVAGEVEVCQGETVTVSVSNPVPGSEYHWYDRATGGTPISTGLTYNVSSVGQHDLYVARARQGCTEESDRSAISIQVAPTPGRPTLNVSEYD